MLAFLRESAHTVHFLSAPECEIRAELCERVTEGGYRVSEEYILLKKVCSFAVG